MKWMYKLLIVVALIALCLNSVSAADVGDHGYIKYQDVEHTNLTLESNYDSNVSDISVDVNDSKLEELSSNLVLNSSNISDDSDIPVGIDGITHHNLKEINKETSKVMKILTKAEKIIEKFDARELREAVLDGAIKGAALGITVGAALGGTITSLPTGGVGGPVGAASAAPPGAAIGGTIGAICGAAYYFYKLIKSC